MDICWGTHLEVAMYVALVENLYPQKNYMISVYLVVIEQLSKPPYI